jgi:hypothetical protein
MEQNQTEQLMKTLTIGEFNRLPFHHLQAHHMRYGTEGRPAA